MRAIDTNILVRLITADHPDQYRIALDTVSSDVLLPMTVLLETGWVLSTQYAMPRHAILSAFLGLLDFPTIHVIDESGLRWALARCGAGADLADMLHIVAAGEATAFLTFDRRIARAAGPTPPIPIETLNPR